MGADARWVCHTCKTVCSGAGRPIFRSCNPVYSKHEIHALKEDLCKMNRVVELEDYNRYTSFLDNLSRWLGRHEDHNFHIGSDYSTDMMDLEDYRDESLGGEVSRLTRHEIDMGYYNDFVKSQINDIKEIITKHGGDVDSAAKELYDKWDRGTQLRDATVVK